MKITKALRAQIIRNLPKNYRKLIVDRLEKKGVTCHPNTVRNTLNGNDNITVALELLRLSNEEKEKIEKLHKEFDQNVKQLSAA